MIVRVRDVRWYLLGLARPSRRGGSSTCTPSTSTGGATTAPSATSTTSSASTTARDCRGCPRTSSTTTGTSWISCAGSCRRSSRRSFGVPLRRRAAARAEDAHRDPLCPRSRPRGSCGRTRAQRCSRSPSGSSRGGGAPTRVAHRCRGGDPRRWLRLRQGVPAHRPEDDVHAAELVVQRAHANGNDNGNATSTNEPSTQSHLDSLRDGIRTVTHHPQGYGLGNAGEVAFRAGEVPKAGESNYTEIGVETGLLGALPLHRVEPHARAAPRARAPRRARRRARRRPPSRCADRCVRDTLLAYCVWWLAGSGLRREPA